MATVGTGKYTYDVIENWGKLPAGDTFGMVSAIATDSSRPPQSKYPMYSVASCQLSTASGGISPTEASFRAYSKLS